MQILQNLYRITHSLFKVLSKTQFSANTLTYVLDYRHFLKVDAVLLRHKYWPCFVHESNLACLQSFINIIDEVLLPPGGAAAAPLPISAGYIAAAFGPAPSIKVQAPDIEESAPSASLQIAG